MTPQTAALHGKITALIAAGTTHTPADTAHLILETIALAISRQLDVAIAAQEDLLEQRVAAGLGDQAHEHAIAMRVHAADRTTVRTYLGLDQTAPTPSPTPPPPAAVPPAPTAPPTPTTDIRHHRQSTPFTWWRRRGEPTT